VATRAAVAVLTIALASCVLKIDDGGGGDPDASLGAPDAPQGAADAPSADPDAAPPAPDAASPPPDPRLGNVLMYTFDRPVADLVFDRAGGGFDGELFGTAAQNAMAVYGGGLSVDGGYIYVAKEAPLVAGPPLTLEAWVYRNVDNSNDTIWSDKDDLLAPAAGLHVMMLPAPGGLEIVTNDACAAQVTITSAATNVPALAWTHVAVAWDGAQVRFYLDGVLTDTQPLTAAPCAAPSTHVRIGNEGDGGNQHRGGLDEVKLSNYAKTAGQIALSMVYDTGALPSRCGDRVVEAAEQCDVATTCCDATSCTYATGGTPCGAGLCQLGVCVGGGGRVTDGLVALWEFDDGAGGTVRDTSGVAPALDLAILDPLAVAWGPGTLTFNASTIARTPGAATKIISALQLTGELTLEAWVAPANTTQTGPSRIATLSIDTGNRNVMLAQDEDRTMARTRASLSVLNGLPEIHARPGDLDASLTHVVLTRTAQGERTLYVDGRPRASNRLGVDLANWDATYPFAIGNEITLDRTWLGTFHLVAVYDRALTAEEVGRQFTAGAD
jgi:hypothetical protein